MKGNDRGTEQRAERLLREKMNGLSSRVDCFDRISAMAYPEKTDEETNGWETVSGVENATGRRRLPAALKWAAAAVVMLFIIGIIPKTALMNKPSHDEHSSRDKYSSLLSRLAEIENSDSFDVIDLPLREYIQNDILITPLFRCPFADSDDKSLRVKIFIRMCGDIPTNEVYAVEYSGVYTSEYIVAAARSSASFTDAEMEQLLEKETEWEAYFDTALLEAVTSGFRTVISGNEAYLYRGDRSVSVASFRYKSYYKDGSKVMPLVSDVLYYRESDVNLCYDIRSQTFRLGRSAEVKLPDKQWQTAVSYDGSKIQTGSTLYAAKNVELFEESSGEGIACRYADCCESGAGDGIEQLTVELQTAERDHTLSKNRILSTLPTPYDAVCKMAMRVFLPYEPDDTAGTVRFITSGRTGYTTVKPVSVSDVEDGKQSGQ